MSVVIDLNVFVRVLFSTFQCAASTLLSFYELHLFLIANFTLRIRRGTIICSDDCVCGTTQLCTVHVYLLVSDVITVLPGTNVLLHWNY